MKGKKFVAIAFAACILGCGALPAHAETSYGKSGWKVAFTSDKKMESNFKDSDISDAAYNLQPGDNAIITLALRNENETATDWYMTNKVLSSLEDYSENASGGAYTYILSYTDPGGTETILFSSEAVGGENEEGGVGLHGATGSLENYFYLDTLQEGEEGKINLEVALDGETQGNAYQDTIADLRMQFAVELNEPETVIIRETAEAEPGKRVVREEAQVSREVNRTTSNQGAYTTAAHTGDAINQIPYFIASAVCGCLLLLFAIFGVKRRKQGEGEEK